MADITYSRTYQQVPYVDGQDVVKAGGENGFNQKFDDIAGEFDKIAGVVNDVNTAIKNIQRLGFMLAQPPVTLAANSASSEFPVEVYDRSALPANVEKVYFAVILPITGSTHIQYTFLYRQAPGNKIGVTVQFFNHDTTASAQFAFRVLTLAVQA